jgi:hypothetical protein
MSEQNRSSESPLGLAAGELAAHYHSQPQLVRDQQGWSRIIALIADDCSDAVRLEISDGYIVTIAAAPTSAADAETSGVPPAHVAIRGPQSLLQRILRLQQSVSEPYLFGELTVEGPEPDFLRLDYIVTTLFVAAQRAEARR